MSDIKHDAAFGSCVWRSFRVALVLSGDHSCTLRQAWSWTHEHEVGKQRLEPPPLYSSSGVIRRAVQSAMVCSCRSGHLQEEAETVVVAVARLFASDIAVTPAPRSVTYVHRLAVPISACHPCHGIIACGKGCVYI